MKMGVDVMAPLQFLWVRMFVSLLIMLPFSYKNMKNIPRGMFWRVVLLGATLTTSHAFGMIGIDKSQAIDGALLYALEPIIAIIYARILLKEKLDLSRGLALIMALIGFGILSNITSSNLLSNLTFVGDFLIVFGIFVDGAFSSISKPIVEKCQARVLLTWILFFSVIFLTPFAILSPYKPTMISWKSGVSIFYLSVICTCVGWTFWLMMLKKYKVSLLSLSIFIQPIVGPFISHFMIGEQISARVWFGGSVILFALFLAVFGRKTSEEELVAEAVIH